MQDRLRKLDAIYEEMLPVNDSIKARIKPEKYGLGEYYESLKTAADVELAEWKTWLDTTENTGNKLNEGILAVLADINPLP